MICPNWSNNGSRSGGSCAKGYHHGRPSFADCRLACPEKLWPDANSRVAGIVLLTVSATAPAIMAGPGTELKKLLIELGIPEQPDCPCNQRLQQMNQWGVQGCRDHLDTIVLWMKESQGFLSPATFVAAAAKAITSGLAFKINPLDPVRGIVLEAIKRAESARANDSQTTQGQERH